MTKYRINWLVVMRNIVVVSLLTSCILANNQINNLNKREIELDNEIKMAQIQTTHSLKSRLLHRVGKVTTPMQKTSPSQSSTTENYLGNFKITHYCACTKCCGKNAQGITASGKRVQEGVTIAVDPKVIKLGSIVKIDGYGEYEAQDTGGAIKGNRIDVYVADHNEALKLGVTNRDVWLVKGV